MTIGKIIDPNAALNAYKNSASMAARGQIDGGDETDSAGSAGGSGSAGGASFSDFLQDKARDSVETLRAGEQASARAVTGDADITEVVQAVTAAETTLQTVVAVRDRMISAYQEIMRMPI